MTIIKSLKPLLAIFLVLFAVSACTKERSGTATSDTAALQNFIVYKTPTCECCTRWVEHMQGSGFALEVEEMSDLSNIKQSFNLQPSQLSCHTAVWQNGKTRYVFEGHVPAPLIQKFLQDTPENAQGLLVPGMPVGSPGMEYGNEHMPYDVLLLKKDGSTEVYAHIDVHSSVNP